jgi:hypothetical protein
MNSFLKKIIYRPTFFSITATLILIIGVPFGLYCLSLKGGDSLGAIWIFLAVVSAFIILIIDRLLITKFSAIKITVIEIIITGIFFLITALNGKSVIIDLSDYQKKYFILMYNNGNLINSAISPSFPFDKKAKNNGNSVVIPAEIKKDYEVYFINPKSKTSYTMTPERIDGIDIEFYDFNNPGNGYNHIQIDSLIKLTIKAVAANNHQ